MTMRDAFAPLDATAVELASAPVADELRVDGSPRTGSIELGRVSGATVGIWEMTVGSMRDIEDDELFVVISGRATVELLEDARPVRVIELQPGSVCRLDAGMHTRWHVTAALRKIYILGEPDAPS